ncbi:thiamine pyrophosphate-dependent dehydrogenase E1 component subunit alpha [Labrys neptuniae]
MSTSVRLALYEQMLRLRLIEEAIAVRYAEQEMRCPTHLCIGQEAVPAGVSANLRPTDLVFSGHRSHGHYLAKGGNLKAMLAELYGRATGCAGGKGGSQHLIDLACGFMGSAPILASTISVGVGAAWAAKMDNEDRVAIVYFGDGATEEGTFHEALNFASVKRLPVVFVCENNLYSVHSSLDVRQPKRPIAALGSAHGMAADRGDGNDVEFVYRLAGEAVARARVGEGPTILEFETYRWLEHCGPSDDVGLGYRSKEELDSWKRRDPIMTYRTRLQAKGLLANVFESALNQKIEQEIDAAFSFAKNSPFPPATALTSHIYPGQGFVA